MPNIPRDYDNVFEKKMSLAERYKMATLVAVISYFTLIGWVVAMVIYDKHQSSLASFHLRQSLGLIITGAILSLIPLVGWILNIGVLFAWATGLYCAIKGYEYKVPLLGDFYQQHLDFIK
ncbi:DUF4870 domain-containing protein [Colwellia psychrerythraea]|uniref:DUF4870 domain-containing protein n=1 Tax=Colwellia psychrerythraea TaxID=28229 RepID=A0A099KQM3_COLPS|nr:hypothetical protein [Colwellia psychrerythraea]KGJ92801.1 hypothetical protein GAB14E_2717 [Colwellia psychrerythraea]